MRQLLVFAVVFALCLSAGTAAAGGKTPEATFSVAIEAIRKEDMKSFVACFTKDSQAALAGSMVFGAAMVKAFAKFDPKVGADGEKVIAALLERHGLSEEALAKLKLEGPAKGDDGKKMAKMFILAGSLVRDRPAFITDATKVLSKIDPKLGNPFKDVGDSTLKEVMIDGACASAKVVNRKKDGTEKIEPFFFLMEDGVWKIDLVRLMEESIPKKK